jgi:hypothetical protein
MSRGLPQDKIVRDAGEGRGLRRANPPWRRSMLRLEPLNLAAFLLATSLASAAAQDAGVEFIRYSKGTQVSRLETAVVTYENVDTGRTVTLIAVAHIGDKGYFEQIQKHLRAYDVVLHEGVQSTDGEAPGDLMWISRLQLTLKDYLGLEHQREALDYGAKNLVRADLSAAAVKTMLLERGVELTPFGSALEGLGPLVEAGLQFLKKRPELSGVRNRMKAALATVLGSGMKIYERMKRGADKERDAVIIGARNDHVFKHLTDLLEKAETRSVAVLYGAAHMPDLATRLRQRPGWKQTRLEWLPAWTIAPAAETESGAAEPEPASQPTSKPRSPRRL